jgi:hypothetical protein
MYVRRRRGFGDCSYEGDPTCAAPCYPNDFVGPIPAGSAYCPPSITLLPSSGSCYPASFVGPLPPGGAYCSQPVGLPAPGCPAGSNCSMIAGVPNTAVYVLGALVGSFILFGALSK